MFFDISKRSVVAPHQIQYIHLPMDVLYKAAMCDESVAALYDFSNSIRKIDFNAYLDVSLLLQSGSYLLLDMPSLTNGSHLIYCYRNNHLVACYGRDQQSLYRLTDASIEFEKYVSNDDKSNTVAICYILQDSQSAILQQVADGIYLNMCNAARPVTFSEFLQSV